MGGPHPLRDPRRKILGKIKAGQIQAVTNTEVLQEIIYRFFSIGNPSLGEVAYRSMVQFCAIILPITLKDTDLALRILKDHPPHYLARCHPRRHHAEPWAKRDHFCRFPLRPHRGDQKNRSGALALKCFLPFQQCPGSFGGPHLGVCFSVFGVLTILPIFSLTPQGSLGSVFSGLGGKNQL